MKVGLVTNGAGRDLEQVRALRYPVFSLVLLGLAAVVGWTQEDNPVAPWTQDVRIAPVSRTMARHSIHSYYVANPESPDGRRVLFFSSTHPAGYVGEVRMLDRLTGNETVLGDNVHTEDAHRAACQQWLAGGKLVAYHEVVNKKWRVVVVDVGTLAKTIVAQDRQAGFGRPDGDLLPLYGCHWNPGPHRSLEIWDAKTGQISMPVRITDVEASYGAWLAQEFVGKRVSIFFPVLSANLRRVFFKLAAGSGGDEFMSKNASHRQGLICYDLKQNAFTWQHAKWGHPAWFPDSRHIMEVGNLIYDSDDGSYTRIPAVPKLSGAHPSVSPDGQLMVTDGISTSIGGKDKEWCIAVGAIHGRSWVLLHGFDQTKGAKSWRRNDPHPVFSADGRRIYYNVSDGPFTRLLVAERQ